MGERKREECPIWEKYALTITEASSYFGIGENTIREWVGKNYQSECLLFIGKKVLIKRRLFEEYLDKSSSLI